jgi:hypothetical protein
VLILQDLGLCHPESQFPSSEPVCEGPIQVQFPTFLVERGTPPLLPPRNIDGVSLGSPMLMLRLNALTKGYGMAAGTTYRAGFVSLDLVLSLGRYGPRLSLGIY